MERFALDLCKNIPLNSPEFVPEDGFTAFDLEHQLGVRLFYAMRRFWAPLRDSCEFKGLFPAFPLLLVCWGRSGFDGSLEVLDACRGAIGLVKKWQTQLQNQLHLLLN